MKYELAEAVSNAASAVSIDWTVSIANIVTIIAFGVGVVVAFLRMQGDIRVINSNLSSMNLKQPFRDALIQIAGIKSQLAVHESRIKYIEDAIRELKRGNATQNDRLKDVR